MKKRYKAAIAAAVIAAPLYFASQKLSNIHNFYFCPFWNNWPIVSEYTQCSSFEPWGSEKPLELQRLLLIRPQSYYCVNRRRIVYFWTTEKFDVGVVYTRQINLLGHERVELTEIEFHSLDLCGVENHDSCYTAGPGAIDTLEEILRSSVRH